MPQKLEKLNRQFFCLLRPRGVLNRRSLFPSLICVNRQKKLELSHLLKRDFKFLASDLICLGCPWEENVISSWRSLNFRGIEIADDSLSEDNYIVSTTALLALLCGIICNRRSDAYFVDVHFHIVVISCKADLLPDSRSIRFAASVGQPNYT